MRKITLALWGALFLAVSCNKQDAKNTAQESPADIETTAMQRQCASDEVLQQQIAQDPQRGRFLEELELKTQRYKGRNVENAGRLSGTLYVPVIVHVVLPNPALVTDAQIISQMNVLTQDFNKANSELSNSSVYLAGYNFSNVADCDIEFYVSQIVRRATTASSFGTNDAVKKSTQGGSNPVSSTTKLNLWVCDLSSGLLGYAQFPGGSSSTDGVVIDYQAFGTSASYPMYTQFNKGRTATHEVGHWFNLRHIWGDRRCGDDLVGDTPQHDASNGGCPANSHRSKCSGKSLEQWMNYMDYTDDRCMYMFTAGQKIRMDAAIDDARSSYVYQTKI